jgi:hypothetical protein
MHARLPFHPLPLPVVAFFRVEGRKFTQLARHSAFRLRLVFILNSVWHKKGLRAWVPDAAAATVSSGLFACFLTLRLVVLIHGGHRVCGKPEWGIILFQVK